MGVHARIAFASGGKNGNPASRREKLRPPDFADTSVTLQLTAPVTLPATASISTDDTRDGNLNPLRIDAAINAWPGGPGGTASRALMGSYSAPAPRALSSTAR